MGGGVSVCGLSEPYALTPRQREALVRYRDYRARDNDKADPGTGLPIETGGREPLWLGAGYLRYRKIYMGSDSYQPADAMYAGLGMVGWPTSTASYLTGETSWA